MASYFVFFIESTVVVFELLLVDDVFVLSSSATSVYVYVSPVVAFVYNILLPEAVSVPCVALFFDDDSVSVLSLFSCTLSDASAFFSLDLSTVLKLSIPL